ncbi:Biopolymer transport protein [Elusimicrobium minutum Pei191]|uniref:Biopolymer transport protein n=1 Tax=Elusimicrobium minutum (strain Pei191) TaxID=445932 RepID=B2KBH9_ELUMP|nr:biopolymer transporter ExbD [Elusimicrobium minutum]ACC98001.1 Biopolymer transport protein [Elusimicrobium minutum Pei191]
MPGRVKKQIMGDINMVPFIDIALILLIIFMVMSPFLVQMQLNVDLPKSSSVNAVVEDDLIRIEVLKDGTIIVQEQKVTMSELQRELTLRMGKANKKAILVQADKDVPVQIVVDVFDIAKELGAAKLGIGVLERK